MTTNEELAQLYADATPAPWQRPEIDVHGGRVTSTHAPKAPRRGHNSSEVARLDNIIALCRSNALADAIAVLHQHLPALLTGKIASTDWETVRQAVRDADASPREPAPEIRTAC